MLLSFVSLGVFVHLVLIYSIFDIYYTSPLVKGTTPHPISHEVGLADRLVLFSADGLRSRTFYQHPEKAPFLQDIIRKGRGSWGVSMSHVPTESRPGHVAMAAGFYEDVSAIAYGWKHNPVPFDSIFNRSAETWSWGSPDILPMFADKNPHIHTFTYSSDEEDFARQDASALDVWVFDRVKSFLEAAKTDEALGSRLRAKKVVFFLHLLGLDSNGHGYKPHSNNYVDNIRVVDEGIRKVAKLFEDFYGDKKTAFIFTSDHGMTDWGSHGSGTDDEIITPLVAWGSGVAQSASKRTVNQVDLAPFMAALLGCAVPLNSVGILPLEMLSGVAQSASKRTVNQVDLAPFMAALLGCAVPLNSVGILPLEMLSGSERYRFQAARANLRQMVDQYYVKREERQKHSLPFLFKDYPEFSFSVLSKLDSGLKDIAKRGQFNNAASIAVSWIPRIRDALLYFHRYQRGSLGIAVAATFGAWIFLIYSVVARLVISRS
uniref:GPI ethanolamine phosphate transferase 1 n=1 Tax=Steinernema glaseri TaxID=37863 RepID=A0A1I7ZLK1_9BILA